MRYYVFSVDLEEVHYNEGGVIKIPIPIDSWNWPFNHTPLVKYSNVLNINCNNISQHSAN